MGEALLRRLRPDYPKRPDIEEDLNKRYTGYRGECNLDYHLGFLPEKGYSIFGDLQLHYGDETFQLDTLILTSKFAMIIESKNIHGELIFQQNPPLLIRNYNGKEDTFPDPLMQVIRQKIHFQRWLEHHKFKSIPVECCVAFSSPSKTMIKNPQNLPRFQNILYAEHVLKKIQESEKKYHAASPSDYLLQKLSESLIQMHAPNLPHILEEYEISNADIVTGVQCPSCSQFPMKRQSFRWTCRTCNDQSKAAHRQAIQDYLLLHHQITNHECRQFLHIPSIDMCKRLLQSMSLPFTGNTKNRTYHLPLN